MRNIQIGVWVSREGRRDDCDGVWCCEWHGLENKSKHWGKQESTVKPTRAENTQLWLGLVWGKEERQEWDPQTTSHPPQPMALCTYFEGQGRMFHWRASSDLEILLCGGGSWLTWDFPFSRLEMRVWQWLLLFSDNSVCVSRQVWNPNVFRLMEWELSALILACVCSCCWDSGKQPFISDCVHSLLSRLSHSPHCFLCSHSAASEFSWGFDTVHFSHRVLLSFCVSRR